MTDIRTLLEPPLVNASSHELEAVVGLHAQGRLDDACVLATQLVDRYPGCEIIHNIAGALATAAGWHEDAIIFYDRAIEIAPDYFEAYTNRGNALKDLGRRAEALASFDCAIALMPEYAEAHLNRAIVLRMDRRFSEALDAIDAALRSKPGLAAAYANRGNVLQEINRFEEALASHDHALTLDPGFALAHLNRGNVLRHLGRLPEAIASYDRAIEIAPTLSMAHRNRGSARKEVRRLPDALVDFERAFALDPADTTALSELVWLDAQMCCWTRPERPAELIERLRDGATVPPFHLLALIDDATLQRDNAARWTAAHFPASAEPIATPAPSDHGKIRIGYFSADFFNHATMALTIRMFELHDPERFEIHAFSYGPQIHDAYRDRVARSVAAFHDISALGDEAAARRARDIGLDIAIDLKGHTENGRPGLFAFRAAARQVSYLGYPGTTGADYVDYVIADRVIAPDGKQAFYTEQVLHMPHSYQANDSARPVSTKAFTRRDLGLPEHGFVFSSLNNAYKISLAEFDIWMRLLSRVEGSVLWLLEDNAWAAANLRREAAQRGVAPDRLVFASRVTAAEHIARQTCADLFLDTFNVNAHTTASEALWAGLPVLTKLGESFAARVAGSLLHAVGLPELVADTAEAYETMALALATDPARLRDIRARLAANRASASLFDTARFTRDLEALFTDLAARPGAI
jgi:predicted O-linked N-acetylglucosamine transferase (SPINDLY family)